MGTPIEPWKRTQIATLKRVFEHWTLDRAFHDAYLADPARALAGTGLDVDPRAVALLLRRGQQGSPGDDGGDLPESFVWYRDLIESRFRKNAYSRVRDAPRDPRFRDWRERQMRRCERELGPRAALMGHLCVAFELTSGCSVGCPFCALAAPGLTGVFRHTDENAALWRDVLARVHATVGEAAGRGICYYATEPLDNPDYELFLRDYFDEFGRVPQTTTAAATRDLGRTRALIDWGQGTFLHYDRLSVLSERDRDILFHAFSPEELLWCDLLPQFEGAPGFNPIRSGRYLDAARGVRGTISCVSGFVVNMCERTVRLVAPTAAGAEHPTGEVVYDRADFSGAQDLEDAIRQMVDLHMHETVDLAALLGGPRP